MREQVSVELKPCPHCGNADITIFNNMTSYDVYEADQVICCTRVFSTEDAIEAWNKRVIEPAEYERLKRLDDSVQKELKRLKSLGIDEVGLEETFEIIDQIRLLEGLYK